MLEYALKQERAKFHRLKFGCDPPTMNDIRPPTDGDGEIFNEVAPDSDVFFNSMSNTTWRKGRAVLRQYLQEIGYTDTIIDVRANRVRALLGLNNNAEQDENMSPSVNGNENNKRSSESQDRRTPAKKTTLPPITATAEAEAAVMRAMEFLKQTDADMSDDEDIAESLELPESDDDVQPLKRKTKASKEGRWFFLPTKYMCKNHFHEVYFKFFFSFLLCTTFFIHKCFSFSPFPPKLLVFIVISFDTFQDVDAEAEEVLNELNLLTESEDNSMNSNKMKTDDIEWSQTIGE